MKRTKIILRSFALALFLGGMASGAAYVVRTIDTYEGVCDELGGFPGLLQSAGLMATGNCKSIPVKKCTGEPCTANGKRGLCTVVTVSGKQTCVCVTKRITK